jgi:anti-anti-sigma factor
MTFDPDSLGSDPILSVWHRREQGIPIVAARGEIDVSSAGLLRDALLSIDHEPHILVDLADVTFVDSTGLGVLINAQKRQQLAHGNASLQLCGLRPTVQRVIEVAGLDSVFTVAPSIEAALER